MAPEPRWAPNVNVDVEHRGRWVGAAVAGVVAAGVVLVGEVGVTRAVVVGAALCEVVVDGVVGALVPVVMSDDGATVTLVVGLDPVAVPEPPVHALSATAATIAKAPAPSVGLPARISIN